MPLELSRKIRAPFNSLTVCTEHYTAVLDTLTPETFILVIGRGGVGASMIFRVTVEVTD